MTKRTLAKSPLTIAQPRDQNQSFVYFPRDDMNALTIRVGLESLLRQLSDVEAGCPGTIHYNEEAHRLEIRWALPLLEKG